MQKFLICDDHALVREALAGTVRLAWPEAQIVLASDFPAAWELIGQGCTFCIADLVMAGASPIAGIEGLICAAPSVPILVVTGTEDDDLLLSLLRLGVAGFAQKTSSSSVIEAAIHLILAGGRYLPPRLADLVSARREIAADLPSDGGAGGETQTGAEALTQRQVSVLKLVAEGLSNKEIARVLGLAPSTVKTHLEHCLSLLGAANRAEASIKARALKLI